MSRYLKKLTHKKRDFVQEYRCLVFSKYLYEDNYQDDIEILSIIMYKTQIIDFETKFMKELFG